MKREATAGIRERARPERAAAPAMIMPLHRRPPRPNTRWRGEGNHVTMVQEEILDGTPAGCRGAIPRCLAGTTHYRDLSN